MFGLYPAAPTRPEDYAVERAGRSLRNVRTTPRGLTPRRLAQLGGEGAAGHPAAGHVVPDPWIDAPALLVNDVIAGPEPWTGTLLDPAAPRPLPIGALLRTLEATPRYRLVWPDGRLRPPRGLAGGSPCDVAAYLDEPAMAHFARELDERTVAALAGDGDGGFDATAFDDGAGTGDAALADSVTAWIAAAIRRGGTREAPRRRRSPRTTRPASAPPGRRRERRLVCRWR